MDAFFGGAAGGAAARARGPGRAPTRSCGSSSTCTRPRSASRRRSRVDTAVLCTTCTGAGTAAGTHPATCDACGGRGEVQSVQRTFLGQVVSARPCPACQGYGTIIPHPCADLRRRRPGPDPAHR